MWKFLLNDLVSPYSRPKTSRMLQSRRLKIVHYPPLKNPNNVEYSFLPHRYCFTFFLMRKRCSIHLRKILSLNTVNSTVWMCVSPHSVSSHYFMWHDLFCSQVHTSSVALKHKYNKNKKINVSKNFNEYKMSNERYCCFRRIARMQVRSLGVNSEGNQTIEY